MEGWSEADIQLLQELGGDRMNEVVMLLQRPELVDLSQRLSSLVIGLIKTLLSTINEINALKANLNNLHVDIPESERLMKIDQLLTSNKNRSVISITSNG